MWRSGLKSGPASLGKKRSKADAPIDRSSDSAARTRYTASSPLKFRGSASTVA
eukprot:gene20084-biopygen10088